MLYVIYIYPCDARINRSSIQKVFRCTIPEGVEVKISSELVKPLVENKMVTKILVGGEGRYKNKDPEGLVDFNKIIANSNVTVDKVSVKGKFMFWEFSNKYYMFSTFGMSGQWSPNEGKHVCLEMRLTDDDGTISHIYFNDPRHFGTVKFVSSRKELLEKLNELGWDPLSQDLKDYLPFITFEFKKSTMPVAQMLMDQNIFAGVGNYIRAEALYLAKISPWRKCNAMTKDEIESLCKTIIEVMQESYKHQGATILTYTDAYGAEGKYSSQFKVYGQKTDPDGHKVIKEDTPDKRTIHWCPTVQV